MVMYISGTRNVNNMYHIACNSEVVYVHLTDAMKTFREFMAGVVNVMITGCPQVFSVYLDKSRVLNVLTSATIRLSRILMNHHSELSYVLHRAMNESLFVRHVNVLKRVYLFTSDGFESRVKGFQIPLRSLCFIQDLVKIYTIWWFYQVN